MHVQLTRNMSTFFLVLVFFWMGPTSVWADPARCTPSATYAGKTQIVSIKTQTMGSLCYTVLLPPGGLSNGVEYNWLVLLHGLGATPTELLEDAGLGQLIYEAMEGGDLPPLIVFMPDGRQGYWTNWTDGKHPWADVVQREYIPDMQQRFPLKKDPKAAALGGLSMGGFGALSIGLQSPETFGTILAMSPTDLAIAVRDQPGRKIYQNLFGSPPDQKAIKAVNPIDLINAGRGTGQKMIIAYGTREAPKFKEGTEKLMTAAKAKSLSLRVKPIMGGMHSYKAGWTPPVWRWWVQQLGTAWAPPPKDEGRTP